VAEQKAAENRDEALAAQQRLLEAKTAAEEATAAAVEAKKQEEEISKLRRRELYAANMQLADQLYHGSNGEILRIEELLTSWIPVDGQA